jgi:hypothetical protein
MSSTKPLFRPTSGQRSRQQSWSRNMISYVFAEWVLLWKARNDAVHGDNTSTRAQAKHSQAIRELEILYSFRDQVLQRDRSLYFPSLEFHMEQPTRSLRPWLNLYRDLLLHSLKEATFKSLMHVRPTTNYFNLA